MWLARALGASPMVSERMLHVVLFVGGAVGMVALLRLFRPRIGPEHLVAGAYFAFNPFSLTFLIPSGLYLNYALAPWFAFVAVRGVRDARALKWPAAFALLVVVAGALNYPGLAYALVPSAIMVTGTVVVARQVSWRDVWRWGWRTAAVTVGVSLAALMKTGLNTGIVSENLATTEAPAAINATSSWAESWRGLGFWLSYYTTGTALTRPSGELFFTSAPVILATFAAPCAALLYVWRSRWRPRLFFAACVVVTLVLMVGSFGVGGPSPYGSIALRVMKVPFVAGFRNSYKAGAGLALGVAALFAMEVITLAGSAEKRSRRRRLAVFAAAAGLIVTGSLPAWAGRLYGPAGNRGVPAYWTDAARWLDAQSGDGRVWMAPGARNSHYRWGDVGDDIADALIRRPHVDRGNLAGASPQASTLISALDDDIKTGTYQPGSMGPIARRIGVRWVLIRNDLDWVRMGLARPAALGPLRADPGLKLVRTFGAPGTEVVDPGDRSGPAASERRLPPVQIYEVRDGIDPTRLEAATPALLVAGDGAAWSPLARQGLLDVTGAIRYTGSLEAAALRSLLAQGAPLVISDSNRRRQVSIGALGETFSATLASTEQAGRITDLFRRAGSQSVAWYRDAARITSPDFNALLDAGSAFRPSSAFDALPGTRWLTGAYRASAGQQVRVDFKRPTAISQARIDVALPSGGGRRVSAATLLFADGSSIPVDLSAGSNAVTFPSRTVQWVAVRADALSTSGIGSFGFTEVSFSGVDLREFVQVPDDPLRLATTDTSLQRQLAVTPTVYSFERSTGASGLDDEFVLRRRFRVAAPRSFDLAGLATLSPVASRSDVDALFSDGGSHPCATGVLNLDGVDQPVTVTGSAADLLAGRSVSIASCRPAALNDGWHLLDASGLLRVDALTLRSGTLPASTPAPASQTFETQNPTSLRGTINAPRGGIFVLGQSFDPGWRASVGGRTLGRPISADGMTAWVVPPGTRGRLSVRFSAQRGYELALALSAVSTAICVILVLRRRST